MVDYGKLIDASEVPSARFKNPPMDWDALFKSIPAQKARMFEMDTKHGRLFALAARLALKRPKYQKYAHYIVRTKTIADGRCRIFILNIGGE